MKPYKWYILKGLSLLAWKLRQWDNFKSYRYYRSEIVTTGYDIMGRKI